VVVVNKVDSAADTAVAEVIANVRRLNPSATIVRATSPVSLAGTASTAGAAGTPGTAGAALVGKRVLVVEDGPTITHGGMPFGAGTVAARHAGVTAPLDPRPFAVGSLADTYARFPHIGAVLPAMGYGAIQLAELEATIRASGCDVVVNGSPMSLARLVDVGVPILDATYELHEVGHPDLADVLQPWIERWRPR
jgi:predicted GTPase